MADGTLDELVEWGGPSWSEQVRVGLDWLGDLSGLRVLEIGTRYGGMATMLALQGAAVTGLDVSSAGFDRARETARRHGVQALVDLRTYSGNPTDLPRGFDVVFSKSTLVLMTDLETAIQHIAAALNPGGRLLAIENARGPLAFHAVRIMRRRSIRPHGARYFTRREVGVVRQFMSVEVERWTRVPPTVLIGAVRRRHQAVNPG